LVYIDETGIDSNLQRQYARAKRGKQVISETCGRKIERTSIISGLVAKTKQLIAPLAFNGYTDAKVFNDWLENELLPELPKNSVIIMDNAAFHKTKRTKEVIEKAGCRLLYLPTYSPDLNPIKNCWNTVKAKYKKAKTLNYNHYDAVNFACN
jgi:transposase